MNSSWNANWNARRTSPNPATDGPPVPPTAPPGDRPAPPPPLEESVIRVFDVPAMTWTLTAVLLLGGGYSLLQAVRSHQATDRINRVLHALMHLVMAAMLWNLAPSTVLAQILFLAGAALWFIIQAVAHPRLKRLCQGRNGRIRCLYHSLTMAAAALMVAMMGHVTGANHGPAPSQEMAMPMSMGHHAMATHPAGTSAGMAPASPGLALALTALFGAAAAVSLFLLLRSQAAPSTRGGTAARRLSLGAEHAAEALGAAVMAIMFAAMPA